MRTTSGLAFLLAGALFYSGSAFAQGVTVFAAASLADVINDIAKLHRARTGVVIKAAYAASSVLARQIENGAPADIFFSADEEWMDYLGKRALLEPATRVPRLGNRLVLIGPAGSTRNAELRNTVDLMLLLGPGGRLATGDPASVPVGRYAQQALRFLGAWRELEPRLARADNVRVALSYVERGEASLGIVYATDAAIAKGVVVIGEFPPASHAPIIYPVAIVARQGRPEVRAFHAFLLGAEAAVIFRRFGFTVK